MFNLLGPNCGRGAADPPLFGGLQKLGPGMGQRIPRKKPSFRARALGNGDDLGHADPRVGGRFFLCCNSFQGNWGSLRACIGAPQEGHGHNWWFVGRFIKKRTVRAASIGGLFRQAFRLDQQGCFPLISGVQGVSAAMGNKKGKHDGGSRCVSGTSVWRDPAVQGAETNGGCPLGFSIVFGARGERNVANS